MRCEDTGVYLCPFAIQGYDIEKNRAIAENFLMKIKDFHSICRILTLCELLIEEMDIYAVDEEGIVCIMSI
jgi:hypothetical protein